MKFNAFDAKMYNAGVHSGFALGTVVRKVQQLGDKIVDLPFALGYKAGYSAAKDNVAKPTVEIEGTRYYGQSAEVPDSVKA